MSTEPTPTAPPTTSPAPNPSAAAPTSDTITGSLLHRLCSEFIVLRERNDAQHKLFDRTLTTLRDALQGGFNTFAADTQKAYQQLKQEVVGEKKVSLSLLLTLLEIGSDLQQLLAARPKTDSLEAYRAWADSLEVEERKVQELLARQGIVRYEATVGTPYHPALHERLAGRTLDGVAPGRIAEQVEPGYASQQPEFVLRRPKVIVTE